MYRSVLVGSDVVIWISRSVLVLWRFLVSAGNLDHMISAGALEILVSAGSLDYMISAGALEIFY
jgi:hypothetical protein